MAQDTISGAAATANPIMLDREQHRAAIHAALAVAAREGRLDPTGPVPPLKDTRPTSWSLTGDQTPFKNQSDRGACWAFAGAAALEAAYHRKFGVTIDVSEEYVFHMGKAFALNRTSAGGPVVQPVENNSSLIGFQGSADIAQKLSENAVPDEWAAPYLASQAALTGILPTLGYPGGQAALASQEDFDALEFCEQHIPLIARVNCRYRAAGYASIGGSPSIEALENVLLANHEVICDMNHLTANVGGHVLILVGFDSNRKVFTAKNSWGEGAFIEIGYANDPNWQILSGWYITDVVDSTYVQNQASWLGNWHVSGAAGDFRMLLRRSEDFAAPGTPTRLGHAYLADGRHDVNGHFTNNGAGLTAFIATGTGPTLPGTETGIELQAEFDLADLHVQNGTANGPVQLSRFNTRFAGIFGPDGGQGWQARHGIDAAAYQQLFDTLPGQGFRPALLNAYSEGRGSRFNAVWVEQDGPAWQAHHGLSAGDYQATFTQLVGQGFHPTIVSGYAENGQPRYAALFEQGDVPAWEAHHGLDAAGYQQTFDRLGAAGFVPVVVSGYRVNLGAQFATIWQKLPGISFIGRHNLTSSQYQAAFDDAVSQGFRLVWVSGYSNGGIANYAAIWHKGGDTGAWQAHHGLDAAGYQATFDQLAAQRIRPAVVSGYGDGFYAA